MDLGENVLMSIHDNSLRRRKESIISITHKKKIVLSNPDFL